MPPRKRANEDAGSVAEPLSKRRSSRQAAAAAVAASLADSHAKKPETDEAKPKAVGGKKRAGVGKAGKKSEREEVPKRAAEARTEVEKKPTTKKTAKVKNDAGDDASKSQSKAKNAVTGSSKEVPEEVDFDSIPTTNPEAPRHDGEWYWLMKAEPETRIENGIDVRFSIDDLRAKTKPEGWDGIRNYVARNHMRNMNVGDKAFFYHSNCKEPGIAGVMEIVKEFSEDVSARQPGTPYYDPQSTKEKPRWSLVHVEFRKKFAVPLNLKELRELGQPGGPLENMQMLKQMRLSVSRVSADEWKALSQILDDKAKEAGLEHETTKL